ADRDGDGVGDACERLHIGDVVFNDGNGNRQQDVGELGIGRVAVNLLDASGTAIASTTTDTYGHYDFALPDPKPGDYTVELDASNFAPGGVLSEATATTPSPRQTLTVGVHDELSFDFGYNGPYRYGPGADGDGDGWPDAVDNCPNDANGTQADRDSDGIGDACDPLQIGDTVFNDVDRDGKQEAGELG